MSDKECPWVIIDGKSGRWLCMRCMSSMAPPDMPQPFDVFIGIMQAFVDGHEKCQPREIIKP